MKRTPNNGLKAFGLAALAALLLGTSAPITCAQTYSSTSTDIRSALTPGTVIPVRLDDQISSSDSRVGDTFTATVDDSQQAYDSLMRGAILEGVVRQVTRQSGKQPGTLTVAFTHLRMPDGRSYAISGSPTNLDTKDLQTRSDGVLVANQNAKKDQSVTYAGIGAGAAVLLNVLQGGKLRLEDILIGGGLGYAAGQILKSQQPKVHDVVLSSGTQMNVLLNNSAVNYHRTLTAAPSHYYTHTATTKTYHKTVTKHYVPVHHRKTYNR